MSPITRRHLPQGCGFRSVCINANFEGLSKTLDPTVYDGRDQRMKDYLCQQNKTTNQTEIERSPLCCRKMQSEVKFMATKGCQAATCQTCQTDCWGRTTSSSSRRTRSLLEGGLSRRCTSPAWHVSPRFIFLSQVRHESNVWKSRTALEQTKPKIIKSKISRIWLCRSNIFGAEWRSFFTAGLFGHKVEVFLVRWDGQVLVLYGTGEDAQERHTVSLVQLKWSNTHLIAGFWYCSRLFNISSNNFSTFEIPHKIEQKFCLAVKSREDPQGHNNQPLQHWLKRLGSVEWPWEQKKRLSPKAATLVHFDSSTANFRRLPAQNWLFVWRFIRARVRPHALGSNLCLRSFRSCHFNFVASGNMKVGRERWATWTGECRDGSWRRLHQPAQQDVFLLVLQRTWHSHSSSSTSGSVCLSRALVTSTFDTRTIRF